MIFINIFHYQNKLFLCNEMEAHYTKLQATLLFCTPSWTIF